MKKYILYFLLGVLLLFLMHKVKEYRNNSPVLIGDKHDASQLLTFSSSDIPFSNQLGSMLGCWLLTGELGSNQYSGAVVG